MIQTFRHKGLRRLAEDQDRRGIPAEMTDRIALILSTLDSAATIEGMDLPSFRLHALKGDLRGHWVVTVRANWRIVFRFQDGDAFDVDFVDYH